MIKKKIKFKNNAEIDLEIYVGYKDVILSEVSHRIIQPKYLPKTG